MADLEWTDISLEEGSSEKVKTEEKVEDLKVEVAEEETSNVTEDPAASDDAGDDGEEKKGRETRAQRLKRQRDDERARNAYLVQKLQALEGQVETLTTVQKKALEVGQERFKESREAQRVSLKKEWGDAFDTGDKEKLLEVQQKLFTLDKEDSSVAILEDPREDPRGQGKTWGPPKGQTPTADPRALAWHKDNQWFNPQSRNALDIAATAFALKKSEELIEDGYDPNSDEYYQKIDEAVGSTFPAVKKTAGPQGPKKTSPVAGGTRGAPGGNSVRLSPDEVARAGELGVDLKSYARQKSRMANSDNGYTVIEL